MQRLAIQILILPALLSACDAGSEPPAPGMPRAGQWELTNRVAEIETDKLESGEIETLETLFGSPTKFSHCVDGSARQMGFILWSPVLMDFEGLDPAKVGAPLIEGHCELTKVADNGGAVDRAAKCHFPGHDKPMTIQITGTQSSESYDLQVIVRSLMPDGSADESAVVTKEEGKRISDCPANGQKAK